MPRHEFSLGPELRQKLGPLPIPIERVITVRASGAQVRSIVGKWPFVVVGLKREDMEYFLRRIRVKRIDGRLPEPGKPEALITEPVARNLKLGLGGVLLSPEKKDDYSPFP
jgi:putative ABC transport system permease protein/lipoprotein-releasing system permease protein